MARKATDLLDVFRFGGGEEDDERESTRPAGRKRRKPPPKAAGGARAKKKTRFEGIALNRRQVWLASSAIGLLLILSFFLGLATGGSGAGEDARALERRVPRRYAIRGRVPLLDPKTHRPADAARVARTLSSDYRIHASNLRVRRLGADLVIDIGPFPSRDDARSWLERSGLELWRIHLEDPFRFPEYVPLDGR